MDSEEKKVAYIRLKTTTRLNYRSACDFTAGSIVGVLDDNVEVSAADDFYEFINGHFWYKIKVGRKHYFAVADWLVKIN